jgi:hypothetical protein
MLIMVLVAAMMVGGVLQNLSHPIIIMNHDDVYCKFVIANVLSRMTRLTRKLFEEVIIPSSSSDR